MEWTPLSLMRTIKEFGALVSHGCCVMKRSGRAYAAPRLPRRRAIALGLDTDERLPTTR
jgi:hypothetical protein